MKPQQSEGVRFESQFCYFENTYPISEHTLNLLKSLKLNWTSFRGFLEWMCSLKSEEGEKLLLLNIKISGTVKHFIQKLQQQKENIMLKKQFRFKPQKDNNQGRLGTSVG